MLVTDLTLLEEPSSPVGLLTKDGVEEQECREIMEQLEKELSENESVVALAAPQIGIKKRVFALKFDGEIKFFINPIITKKVGQEVGVETFANLPGKEILTGRPEEITAVYYNNNFKYEDNKISGYGARVFDQMCQLLDGILPSELGLVSDIEEDGSLSELSEEELKEVSELWKKFVQTKLEAMQKEILSNEEDAEQFKKLKFTEDVINGRTLVMDNPYENTLNREQRRAAAKLNKKLSKSK